MSNAEFDLACTQTRINGVRHYLQVLALRFDQLDRMPHGRTDMPIEQRIEYDLIGALFSDMRATIAKATGGKS
jgi:hypothetical protein